MGVWCQLRWISPKALVVCRSDAYILETVASGVLDFDREKAEKEALADVKRTGNKEWVEVRRQQERRRLDNMERRRLRKWKLLATRGLGVEDLGASLKLFKLWSDLSRVFSKCCSDALVFVDDHSGELIDESRALSGPLIISPETVATADVSLRQLSIEEVGGAFMEVSQSGGAPPAWVPDADQVQMITDSFVALCEYVNEAAERGMPILKWFVL